MKEAMFSDFDPDKDSDSEDDDDILVIFQHLISFTHPLPFNIKKYTYMYICYLRTKFSIEINHIYLVESCFPGILGESTLYFLCIAQFS